MITMTDYTPELFVVAIHESDDSVVFEFNRSPVDLLEAIEAARFYWG